MNKKENGLYDIGSVANWFLKKEPMDQKKLQKLCYYAYAWYLYMFNDIENGLNNRLFFNDIEGWVHGPVSSSLYKAFPFKGLEKLNVNKYYKDIPDSDNDTIQFLKKIYEVFGEYSGTDLELMTHSEMPWKKSREGLSFTDPGTEVLDDELVYRQCALIADDEDLEL